MPVYTSLRVCVSIFPCLRKVNLNVWQKAAEVFKRFAATAGPYSTWLKSFMQSVKPLANPEVRGRASPQAHGAASLGSQHEWSSRRCVLVHTSRRAQGPCPAIRRNEGGGQEDEFKYSSGEGRGDTREMQGCSDE